jgi:hypothetical protein
MGDTLRSGGVISSGVLTIGSVLDRGVRGH